MKKNQVLNEYLKNMATIIKSLLPKNRNFFLIMFPEQGDTESLPSYVGDGDKEETIKILRQVAYQVEREEDKPKN